MDFGALPPEINSGRMYSGAGCGPMLAAAAAWDGLAADLHSTAASCQSVISDVIGAVWLGPAAVAMTAATAPYVAWLTTTAALCEQTATQARAAAVAYEAAFAMTVPPAIVAANPFSAAAGNRTVAIFLDEAPPADALAGVTGREDEEVVLGVREIYVHYPNGMGRSKLKIPAARSGTGRKATSPTCYPASC